MNKLFLFVVGLLLFPSVSFASFDTDLQYGSKGDQVVELQEFLKDQGLFTGEATGSFYSLTQSAVRRFQAVQSITPVSGYFGPKTRLKANSLLSVSSSEEEATSAPVTEVPDTTSVIDSLSKQLAELMAQLNEMVKQQTPTVSVGTPTVPPVQVSPVTTPEPIPTPSVEIRVNGSSASSITLEPNGCIVGGTKTCAHAEISWKSDQVTFPGCGITGTFTFAGNFGTSGSKTDNITRDTTINIQCNANGSIISDSILVDLNTAPIVSAYNLLKEQASNCRKNPIPIGDQNFQCAPYEEKLKVLEQVVNQI